MGMQRNWHSDTSLWPGSWFFLCPQHLPLVCLLCAPLLQGLTMRSQPQSSEVCTFLHEHSGAFFRVCPPGFGVCVSAAAVSHLQEHHHHRGVLCPAGHPAGHHLPDGAFGPMAARSCFKLALGLCWARGTVTVELGSPRSSALCEEQFTLAAPAALCCYTELGSLGLRFCYFCLGSGSAAVFLIN